MKKVFQTIVNKGKGNCLQATVASLFEKKLEEVPHFIESTSWYEDMNQFYKDNGYSGVMALSPRRDFDLIKIILKHDGGVKGYWDATVKSQTFEDTYHAVIIDKNLNIVHDPNPNQKSLLLGPKDIIEISVVKDDWYIDEHGKFVIE